MARTSDNQWIDYIGGVSPWFSDESKYSDNTFQFPEIEPDMKIPTILSIFLFVLCILLEYFDVQILQCVLSVNFDLLFIAFLYGAIKFIFSGNFLKKTMEINI
ncbi:hypothetical protein Anas_14298 [Armadillidium nasatum]|uniref:Uncharacterized protein n=1 Tax=Armadillidium nasatum TaxID=96803 RepID=A0A5N5TBP3_9CRUS|nr:hypothetical protein Anas_14298 [Armadillidium nasatum]